MNAKIELDNVRSFEVERILLVDKVSAVYKLTFSQDSIEISAVVTQEVLNDLHKLTLMFQPGMPGYQGMLD